MFPPDGYKHYPISLNYPNLSHFTVLEITRHYMSRSLGQGKTKDIKRKKIPKNNKDKKNNCTLHTISTFNFF